MKIYGIYIRSDYFNGSIPEAVVGVELDCSVQPRTLKLTPIEPYKTVTDLSLQKNKVSSRVFTSR